MGEGVESGRGDARDIFVELINPSNKRKTKQKTKDVVQPLKVTLEELYNGATKKMAITRQVIDKKRGVESCSDCNGRGVKVEVFRMGPMVQQMQSQCNSCGGAGKSFQTKLERDVVEVHIQKGSSDGHRSSSVKWPTSTQTPTLAI